MERKTFKLNVWFGSKAFGFIISDNPYEKSFLHISKMRTTEPTVDEVVTLSVMPQREGKFRSGVDALIEAQAVQQ